MTQHLSTSQQKKDTTLLLKLFLAITVAMTMAAIGIWREINAMKKETIIAQTDNLITLSAALQNYQTTHFDKLTTGHEVDGVDDPLAPTIAELTNIGFLSDFSANNFYGGTYTLSVQTVATTQTVAKIHLKGLVCLTTPITNTINNRPNTSLIEIAIARAGGNSGYSNTTTPAIITGLNDNWNETNPILTKTGSPIAGILCMRSGYGSIGFVQRYKQI